MYAGKRLPLYGVVGGAFLLGGYVFFFYTAKHPETTANTSRKNQELPGEEHNKQAQGVLHNCQFMHDVSPSQVPSTQQLGMFASCRVPEKSTYTQASKSSRQGERRCQHIPQ